MSAVDDGSYTIHSVKNSKHALDVNEQHKLTAKKVDNADYWEVEGVDGEYCTITHKISGYRLDLSARCIEPGTKVQSYKRNDTIAQQWMIQRVGEGAKPQYGIKYYGEPTRVVTTSGVNGAAILGVKIATVNFEDSKQLWYFTKLED